MVASGAVKLMLELAIFANTLPSSTIEPLVSIAIAPFAPVTSIKLEPLVRKLLTCSRLRIFWSSVRIGLLPLVRSMLMLMLSVALI